MLRFTSSVQNGSDLRAPTLPVEPGTLPLSRSSIGRPKSLTSFPSYPPLEVWQEFAMAVETRLSGEIDHNSSTGEFSHIDQQPPVESTALLNPLKRTHFTATQEWNGEAQYSDDFDRVDEMMWPKPVSYHSSGENLNGTNTSGFCHISRQRKINPITSVNTMFKRKESTAAQEWYRRKQRGEKSSALDELMEYQGLEEVKQHFLGVKSIVEICKEQDPDGTMNVLSLERFNVVFQGNPGTGECHIKTSQFLNNDVDRYSIYKARRRSLDYTPSFCTRKKF